MLRLSAFLQLWRIIVKFGIMWNNVENLNHLQQVPTIQDIIILSRELE